MRLVKYGALLFGFLFAFVTFIFFNLANPVPEKKEIIATKEPSSYQIPNIDAFQLRQEEHYSNIVKHIEHDYYEREDPTQTEGERIEKQEKTLQTLSEKIGKTHNIPSSWLRSIYAYNYEREKKDYIHHADGSKTVGHVRINTKTAKWLAGKRGIMYQESSLKTLEGGLDYAGFYLRWLKKQKNDPHFVFTAYRYGVGGAESLHDKQGSYITAFSQGVLTIIEREGGEGG